MKKFIVWMFALAALRGSVLQGQNVQNLTGTWQGALKSPNGQLRIVVKISLADDKLRAVLYSIDQQSPPIPASTITSDGSTVKMTVAVLNGNY